SGSTGSGCPRGVRSTSPRTAASSSAPSASTSSRGVKNPAAGGGRWVDVPPERLAAWITAFTQRHGGPGPVIRDEAGATVTFCAADGATAECHPPFPPLPCAPAATAEAIAAHATAERTVGVLLVRLGGYAAGVFVGVPP